jgi:thioredoxin-related protein
MAKPILTLLIAGALLFANSVAQAAELLMLEQKGCAWCQRWDQEIAPIYPKTEHAENVPLRRVDISEPWPEDLSKIRREVFTPTFILVDDGEEIARMRGYNGDEFFWFLLNEMMSKLKEDQRSKQPA